MLSLIKFQSCDKGASVLFANRFFQQNKKTKQTKNANRVHDIPRCLISYGNMGSQDFKKGIQNKIKNIIVKRNYCILSLDKALHCVVKNPNSK